MILLLRLLVLLGRYMGVSEKRASCGLRFLRLFIFWAFGSRHRHTTLESLDVLGEFLVESVLGIAKARVKTLTCGERARIRHSPLLLQHNLELLHAIVVNVATVAFEDVLCLIEELSPR